MENQFSSKIKNFYFDNGGEFVKIKSYFQTHGITHLTTPPHTPRHNGLCECKHRHLLEKLQLYEMPPSSSLSLTVILALCCPNSCLPYQPSSHTHTKYEFTLLLFKNHPSYTKLKSFGCLCFPWLKPYTSNKLQPRSERCVFLGYSLTQSAYICYNFKTQNV